MLRIATCLLLVTIGSQSFSQQLGKLTVEKIMRDPDWIGTSPSNVQWSNDGKYIYFNWNPEKALADSVYYITLANKTPVKATPAELQAFRSPVNFIYNSLRSAYVYAKQGDIFYTEVKTGKTKRIVQTAAPETNPQFSFNDTKVIYNRDQNLYAWDISSGETLQLTNLTTGNPPGKAASTSTNMQEDWLKNDQLAYFEVLKSRKEKREKGEAYNKTLPREKELRTIYIEDKNLQAVTISPDGRYISYRLFKPAAGKPTIVPSFVTETGFTTDIQARTKVGAVQGSSNFFG